LDRKRSLVLSLIAIALVAIPALAHHGSAISYETRLDKAVTMRGTVTQFVWRNPHVYIIYNVKDANGNVVEWSAETSSPSTMTGNHNWTRTTIKPGDEITFTLLPSKIATSAGILYKAVAADGRVILEDKSRLRGDPTAE
jgi:Family of unknown function (DUF6152)